MFFSNIHLSTYSFRSKCHFYLRILRNLGVKAICSKTKEKGIEVNPEIMIPLVVEKNELKYVKERITEAIEEIFAKKKTRIDYKVGTMVEVPRACLTADEIAEEAEFFSFGTNDLTQITFGFSRDDAGKFIKEYVDKGIFEKDPFISIDKNGVWTAYENGY